MSVVLDEDQLKVVNASIDEKRICVVAGAGSGKTTVLTERIRHLIVDKGVPSADIIAITFTNAAADEMRERLSDVEGYEDIFIGTIHSFANTLLHVSVPEADYTVLSDEQFKKAAIMVCKKYCKKLTGEKLIAFMDMKEKKRRDRITTEEFDMFLDSFEKYEYEMMMRPEEAVVNSYNKNYPDSIFSWCFRRNILTFDNIIKLAKENLCEYFSFPFLFVDEYQDVGILEDSFVRALNADHVCIVGDDWQSIYGFKGANVNLFKSYVNNPEWSVFHLERNYRSTKEIIRLAEQIISDDAERLPKNVKVMRGDAGSVQFDCRHELIWHLKAIRKTKKYGNWFLLTRTQKDVARIIEFCALVGLPAFQFSREGMSKQQEQEMLAENAAKIATIHSVKGLESDNVLLFGKFPIHGKMSSACMKNPEKLERWYEERRVMYVGVTRAKDNLVLLSDENM